MHSYKVKESQENIEKEVLILVLMEDALVLLVLALMHRRLMS